MNLSAKIGAFFDLDGTLIASPSLEWRFLAHLLARDAICRANMLRWLKHCAKTIVHDRLAAVDGNKLYLAGLAESLAADWTAAGMPNSPPFYLDGMARLAWHHTQRHRVFLVSGTLAPLARAIAPCFPCPMEIVASELKAVDGHWTGWLADKHMSGYAKARALQMLATKYRLDLNQSFAYGNHSDDIPMLESVGNPVAVNPSWRLTCTSRLRGWRICKWKKSQGAVRAASSRVLAPKEAR
ncbi:MAG: HAD family hydrolase [Candidatus Acidiferrales bacterium]